jgi:hypothetical protein
MNYRTLLKYRLQKHRIKPTSEFLLCEVGYRFYFTGMALLNISFGNTAPSKNKNKIGYAVYWA